VGEVLKFESSKVLKLVELVLFVMGVWERAARVWDTEGKRVKRDKRDMRVKLVGLVLFVMGVWERAARVWNTVEVEMLMRLVEVEMLGIGKMGHRGWKGRGMAKEWKRQMLVRLVLVRETGQVMVVQHMGQETRPQARRVEGRPASRLPEPIRARDGG
jgi:hypothetical protein